MIIKSIRHTQFLSNYSINYLFDGVSDEPEDQWLIFQNISQGFERNDIIQEFNDNASYLTRTPNRKKVYRYHAVLAFDYESSKYVTRAKQQRIAHEYLRLRDPKGLSKVVCVPHLEQGKHFHIHVLSTSNYLESQRSSDMMMNNEQYYSIRRGMEKFVLLEMPELHRSTVFLPEQEIEQLLPPKYRSERRLIQLEKSAKKHNHQKDKVSEIVHELLHQSNTLEEFSELLQKAPQIQPYYRNGKLTGVIHERKKKYRLKTLGLSLYHENFQVLKRMEELKRINDLEQSNELER